MRDFAAIRFRVPEGAVIRCHGIRSGVRFQGELVPAGTYRLANPLSGFRHEETAIQPEGAAEGDYGGTYYFPHRSDIRRFEMTTGDMDLTDEALVCLEAEPDERRRQEIRATAEYLAKLSASLIVTADDVELARSAMEPAATYVG